MKVGTAATVFLAGFLLLFSFGGCTCGSNDGLGSDDEPLGFVLKPEDDDTGDDDIDDDTADDDTTDDDTRDDDTGDDDTVDPEAPVTTADPEGGWFGQAITVTLTSVDNDTLIPMIFYTTDGSDPEPGQGTTQEGCTPLTTGLLADETTLKFFAIDDLENREAIKEEIFHFDYEGPTCSVDVGSGVFNGPYPPLAIDPLTVTITCVDVPDSTSTVFYTLDGSDPSPGSPGTFEDPSPVQVEIPQTLTLTWQGVDHVGNEDIIRSADYDIYFWDDFEAWATGQTPGAPWTMVNDPWQGTIPTVEPLFTPPGGQILQMIDDNLSPDGPRDTWAAMMYARLLDWATVMAFQADMRLRANDNGGFGTYFKEGTEEPWRVLVFFRDGDIKAYNQPDPTPFGEWITCLSGFVYDQWYAVDVHWDRGANTYDVFIDGSPTPCVDLSPYYDGVGTETDVLGVKFATEGTPEGTLEVDNLRIYEP